MVIRFAEEKDLDRVNELRKQVSELHAAGRPETFKAGFSDELRDYIQVIWNDPDKQIVVAETKGAICGFAVLRHIQKLETSYKQGDDCLDIDEFGVDDSCRRQGVATELIRFIREYAKEQGLRRIELNMWEFNRSALAFYEAVGFSTFRRYMEMTL